MDTFKKFLIEDFKQNNGALIVLQKIIDMVDDGHVEYDAENKRININVGKLIKDNEFYDITIVIREQAPHNIRLAKDGNDKFVLVIDTSKLPAREKIDTFLSKKENVEKFNKEFSKYLESHHTSADERGVEASTAYEKSKKYSNREDFEEQYNELMTSIRTQIEEYKKAKTELESEKSETGSPGRISTIDASIKHLKNDYFGNSSSEFVSKMLKNAGEFKNHLTPELKKKLQKRLEDFYEHLDA